MTSANSPQELTKYRRTIAGKIRRLREARHLTQAELAARLGISQGRLSEIERGAGSFTAEQLVVLMQLFNVTASELAGVSTDREDAVQNALARLGAKHLMERSDVVVDGTLESVPELVREVLAGGSPRHLTSLGPVMVLHADELRLHKLLLDVRDAALTYRLLWLVENVLNAIRTQRSESQPRVWASKLRRAEVVLGTFFDTAAAMLAPVGDQLHRDVLDPSIRSAKSVRETEGESSAISRRWGIVTALQPSDFAEALRAAR
jgi:transcriptional regulator with XRE-family HTH domain